jgi:hypothetical protein
MGFKHERTQSFFQKRYGAAMASKRPYLKVEASVTSNRINQPPGTLNRRGESETHYENQLLRVEG